MATLCSWYHQEMLAELLPLDLEGEKGDIVNVDYVEELLGGSDIEGDWDILGRDSDFVYPLNQFIFQKRLHDEGATKATMAPLIIATNKTQLTQFSGSKSAYPVYLTLGNLPKSIH
jgi:Plavaka transposase